MLDRSFSAEVFALLVDRMTWTHGAAHPNLVGPNEIDAAGQAGVMWAVGVEDEQTDLPILDVRAVRGPWTANALTAAGNQVPAVFGDAVLLIARYVPELKEAADSRPRQHTVLVIIDELEDAGSIPDGAAVVAGDGRLSDTLTSIATSEFVVSPSVTVIAVAESLGIPARLFADPSVSRFAQRDYLLGTGRPFARISDCAAEAIRDGAFPAPRVDLDLLESAFPCAYEVDVPGGQTPHPVGQQISQEELVTWQDAVRRPIELSDIRDFVNEFEIAIDVARPSGNEAIERVIADASRRLERINPDWVAKAEGGDGRVLSAIVTRNIGHVVAALAIRESPIVVRLLHSRTLSRELLIGIALVGTPTRGEWPEVLTLGVESLTGNRRYFADFHLFEQQRSQWRIDIDILVPLDELAGDERWTLSLTVDKDVFTVTTGAAQPLSDPWSIPAEGAPAILALGDVSEWKITR